MSKQLVISVMSKDRPGIISDITTVIFDLGGDLADLNQSVLGGYFSMILIAEFEKKITPEDLIAGFSHIQSDTKIEANILEMASGSESEFAENTLPEETYIVTAQGENRKGLVKIMGDFFVIRTINVLDLVTTKDKQVYTMIFQVDLTRINSMKTLRNELEMLGEKEHLNLVLQHNDIFMATHEVGTSLESITRK